MKLSERDCPTCSVSAVGNVDQIQTKAPCADQEHASASSEVVVGGSVWTYEEYLVEAYSHLWTYEVQATESADSES